MIFHWKKLSVLRSSLTVEELKEYCTNSPMLSSYKWPRIYNIVDSLPHTATGKIMHRALRKQK